MARTWTSEQQKAIETRGKTLLVSAAAGSGKTSTLTERIIRSITDKNIRADLSRMLIVTFTRASAADMKKKISEALAEAIAKDPSDRHLATQMMLLDSAKICTIDSFYYDLVKTNFSALSLPGDLRIGDSSEMALLYRNELEAVIERFYNEEPDFPPFIEHFTTLRNSESAVNIFLSVYQKVLSYREGLALLERYANDLTLSHGTDFFRTPHGIYAKKSTLARLEHCISVLEAACEHFTLSENPTIAPNYLPAFQNDLDTALAVKDALVRGSYEDVKARLDAYTPLALGRGVRGADELTVRYKGLRDDVKGSLLEIKNTYFAFSAEELSLLASKYACVLRMMHRVLSEFEDRLFEEKRARGVFEFADIRRFAMKLTVKENGEPTDLALAYRERFDEIYIDEYQDVDEVQDLIFRTISKDNNRFMVGDIKQSIYGFRGANSDVFAGYKKTFPILAGGSQAGDAASVFMSDNFRCDENIVKFSNLVFSHLFSVCGENIGYQKEDDLKFSKLVPPDCQPQRVILALTGNEDPSMPKSPLKAPYDEAYWIATEIRRLVGKEKKADGSPIQYRDVTILSRGKRDFPILKDVLDRFSIPSKSDEITDFFENPDVLLILSLLCSIDNPRRDVSLAGTLRSPFFGFTMDDLVVIRRGGTGELSLYDDLVEVAKDKDSALGQKCKRFVDTLAYWRHKARSLPTSKLLKKLYRDLSVLSISNGKSENLLRLYEYARGYEASGYRGLNSFVAYVNELIERGTTLENNEGDKDINAVSIMTVHHSKGLEFPVCFLYGCGKDSSGGGKDDLIFDPTLGFAFWLRDESGFGKIDTPFKHAITARSEALGREEEMRILYVALTRARERLYLTASVSKPDKLWETAASLAQFSDPYSLLDTRSYLKWITAAIYGKATEDILTVVRVDKIYELPTLVSQETSAKEEPLPDRELQALLEKRFNFVYPYEHVSDLPAKLSVSKLYPTVLDEEEELSLYEDTFLLPESLITAEKASAAERGTATHTFLQFCDFEFAKRNGVREELARLVEKCFIDKRMAEIVNVRQLERFFESDLFSRMRAAKRLWREQRFNILLPAVEFTSETEKKDLLQNENIAVQGVIDLFFEEENGNIVLVDYKTDYLTEEERQDPALAMKKLAERHGEQVTYYAKAIELMCGKAPAERLIYSLPLGNTLAL